MTTPRNLDAQLDDLETNPEQAGTHSAGQSGDTQGLSHAAEAADESVEELIESGQAFEAEVIEGVEDAADHPEQPTHTHEDRRRP